MAKKKDTPATPPAPPAFTHAPGVDLSLLKRIHDATMASPEGFVYVTQAEGATMLSLQLIVLNMGLQTPHGGVAARTTTLGAEYLALATGVETEASAPPAASLSTITTEVAKPKFVIKTGFVAPEAKAHSGAPTIYPFDVLEIGQFFFLPDEPGRKAGTTKDYNSTVSSANARLSPKRFKLAEATEDGVKGVNIGRVADLTVDELAQAKVRSASRSAARQKTAAEKATAEANAKALAAHAAANPQAAAPAPWNAPDWRVSA